MANIEQKWINEQMNNKISIIEKKNECNQNKFPFNSANLNTENNYNIQQKNYYNPSDDTTKENICCIQ